MNDEPAVRVARALLAPSLVVAIALLVKGHEATGGGFAAGVVAGLGVLMQHFVLGREAAERTLPWARRADRIAVAGVAIAASTILLPVALGLPPVHHLPATGNAPIELGALALDTTLVFELGVALATFGFVVAAARRLERFGREDGR